MSDKKIRTMVMAAVLAALACVATMVVQSPSPMNGYVNLGGCFVLLSGWLLGPWWGAAAGGIGSMLADLLLGYGHYAPGTLVIKGLMALVGALVFKAFGKSTVGTLVSGVVSEVIMVAGYFGYAALLLGRYRNGTQHRIVTVGSDGSALAALDVDGEVLSISAAGRYVAVLFSDHMTIYDKTLTECARLDAVSEARQVLMRADGSAVLAGSTAASLYLP